MSFSDVVDVLIEQHDRIRRLSAGVEQSRGETKRRRFAEFATAVYTHELGERLVVHPATRNVLGDGDTIGVARLTEESAIERSLVELRRLGTAHPGFDVRFAEVHLAIQEHLTAEEREEFPLLRHYVPTQRLHMMAGQLHDVQLMDAA